MKTKSNNNHQYQSRSFSKPENPNQDSGTSPPTHPAFEELCVLEPRLLTLYHRILALQYDDLSPAFRRQSAFICGDALWDGCGYPKQPFAFRREMSRIVGWLRRDDPEAQRWLATSDSYDIVYDKLYDVLHRRFAHLLRPGVRGQYVPPEPVELSRFGLAVRRRA